VIRSEVQIRLKKKVYIHTRATIKGEEVDICARETIHRVTEDIVAAILSD
jgi:hypothetical protein